MALDATLDIISKLNDLYTSLNGIIIDSSPKNDEERQQLRQLLAKRDELRDTIKKALSAGFANDVTKLNQASDDITAAAGKIDAAKGTLETAKTALAATAQVIAVVAQVIA